MDDCRCSRLPSIHIPIMGAAQSDNRSAFSTMVRLTSNVGMYLGDVVLMSQPLLPIGMKTPSCIQGLRGGEDSEIRT